ncbi:MAG TPA: hypothetical protein ENK79_02335 [Campylobacterales bacterium]|nr:hypothetical protein [Campylobacterales bacterium]
MKKLSYSYDGGFDTSVIDAEIGSKIKTKILDEMESQGNSLYDAWASEDYVGILEDRDDQIGDPFFKFVIYNELTEPLPINYDFTGDDAHYKITGSIFTETFPTIDKLIKEYRWSLGWSSVEFYEINHQLYLFLLKVSDGTVHIHEMNSDGTVGRKVEEHDWSSGWTTAEFYTINNKTYLFLLKSNNGLVHIHEMTSHGTVGRKVEEYDWSSGWTTAEFYTINNKTYLFLLKSSNGLVHIHEMNSDGTVGRKVEEYDWSSGWTTAEFYTINNKTYLFLLKSSNGLVHIHEMNSDGTVGRKVEEHDWRSGWRRAEFFTTNNKTYLLLSKLSGKIHMHQMNDHGKVGRYIDVRQWGLLSTSLKPYKLGYRNFLFSIVEIPMASESFVHIHSLKYDNLMSYNTIKNDLKYGDIVLFSGDSLGSGIIQVSSLSKWSHVGIVYQEASTNKDVMLLEAVPKYGVRLISLGEKIINYDGQIAIRSLSIDRTSYMKNQLHTLYAELKGRSYESLPNMRILQDLYIRIKENEINLKDIKTLEELRTLFKDNELAKAAFDMYDTEDFLGFSTLNHKNLEKLFCSELVAEAYQRMGLLPQRDEFHPSNEYIPHDFSACESLTLLKGELLEEIVIK